MHIPSPFTQRKAVTAAFTATIIATLIAGLAACGGSNEAPSAGPVVAPPTAPEVLKVTLTGEQEAPKVIASAANAKATLTLDRSTRTISGSIVVDGLVPTLAHIHAGDPGIAGPVIFPMTISGNTATLAPTVLTADQLTTLDAGGFYYNVHSAANPGGEIRGQIGREVFVAHMTGSQQTTAVESAASGDARLVINPVTGAVSGDITMQNISATAAHVHTGVFGTDGAILIPMDDKGDHAHFSIPAGTVMKPADIDTLRAGGMYFNAHTTAHTAGEIRGQIGRRVLLAAASGGHEVPSNASAATGKGFVLYNAENRTVQGKLSLTGINATIAHIHQAAAGISGAVIVPLTQAAGTNDWLVSATAPALTVDQAQSLLTEGLYYNAHSAGFPNGEIRGQIVAATDDASPVLHIVSPAPGVSVARGEGIPGTGSFNGTGFSINLEMITRDAIGIGAQESLNIRNTALLGQANPNMPTLVVTFDADLIKPDGTIIPKGTNLASLFNIAGSDDTAGPGITLWSGWHVLESFREETTAVTITASITDKSGRTATDHVTYSLLPGHVSGQFLTPLASGIAGDGIDDANGPVVTMIAPRPSSSVATGPLTGLPTPPANASLIFVQVSALDKAGAGIAVNENGD
uniref:CHRD domain-containing protein n=1 Tax=Undibacterium sp. TaxID=1914977 RepID=UPI00374D25B8